MSFPLASKSKFGKLSRSVGKVVRFHQGGSTNELHPFTKSNETGLGLITDWTVLLSGILQVSIIVYYARSHKRPFIESFAKRLSGPKCVSGSHLD